MQDIKFIPVLQLHTNCDTRINQVFMLYYLPDGSQVLRTFFETVIPAGV